MLFPDYVLHICVFFFSFVKSYKSVSIFLTQYHHHRVSVADIRDHGLPNLSVFSSPDELIVGRFFYCYEIIQTVCVLTQYAKKITVYISVL